MAGDCGYYAGARRWQAGKIEECRNALGANGSDGWAALWLDLAHSSQSPPILVGNLIDEALTFATGKGDAMKLIRSFSTILVAGALVSGCQNKVEEAVKRVLIDGDSAKFDDVKRCSADNEIYSGRVNAKNRMGAYTGFEPFFYDGTHVAFAADRNFTELMNRCYHQREVRSENAGQEPDSTSNNFSPAPHEETKWIINEDTNPVDDSKTRRATLIADEGSSSMGDSVSLTIRCMSNKTELFVNWNDFLGDDSHDVYNDWKNVIVRVGENKAQQQRWDISTDSKATFAPGSPIDLIKRMLKAERLVLRTTPYNENPVTAVFMLKGMENAVAPIAEECGWKL